MKIKITLKYKDGKEETEIHSGVYYFAINETGNYLNLIFHDSARTFCLLNVREFAVMEEIK